MPAHQLTSVLEATGYLSRGEPAHGVVLDETARHRYRGALFSPDALWRSTSDLTVYFKFVNHYPGDDYVASWRQEIWNTGFAPLLWIVSPNSIDLYNAFGSPRQRDDAQTHHIQTFSNIADSLTALDMLAGRIAMETGQFWSQLDTINRNTGVDQRLLRDLASLEDNLIHGKLNRQKAQDLIGQCIFIKYLVDRHFLDSETLNSVVGYSRLTDLLCDRQSTTILLDWLSETFNGDIFPHIARDTDVPHARHLRQVADFLRGRDPTTGQMTFFPYNFNVIPIELISAIYEQFAHRPSPRKSATTASKSARASGIYYTPIPLVGLILDELLDGISGEETVVDVTCGSGVFLVESLRRLVAAKSYGASASREMIRRTLREQIFGVDISDTAVRVASLSLYLAALDLDVDTGSLHGLRFDRLVGNNLITGDTRQSQTQDDLQSALFRQTGSDRVDIVVGNPPWTYRGKAGTASRRSSSRAPLQPRGESLDFIEHAMAFSHEGTRFGLVLGATSLFGRSRTGIKAARHVLKTLSPVTIVNLANLSSWLFANAKMPAVAFFGRHRSNDADQVTVVKVPWSPSGERSRSFELSPSDVISVSMHEWTKSPYLLRASFHGYRRDLYLLDRLSAAHGSLEANLRSVNTSLNSGVKIGNRSRVASFLQGLPYLTKDALGHYSIRKDLPPFTEHNAERPRESHVYKAPLLLIKEVLLSSEPRAISAVANHDVVFSDAYFGAPFDPNDNDAAHLLAGILGSSLATWFFLMTASSFGLWYPRLLKKDILQLPTPDIRQSADSPAGRHTIDVVRRLHDRDSMDLQWGELDNAVFDLYGLDGDDRTVINDGLFRAWWQWKSGRLESVRPATTEQLCEYARTFLSVIDGWLSARGIRHMRATVLDLPQQWPLRVIQFVLEDSPGTSIVTVSQPEGTLNDLISQIGDRLQIRISDYLTGSRELRVHNRDELIIIKPCARRHWLGVSALEDADSVLSESFAKATV